MDETQVITDVNVEELMIGNFLIPAGYTGENYLTVRGFKKDSVYTNDGKYRPTELEAMLITNHRNLLRFIGFQSNGDGCVYNLIGRMNTFIECKDLYFDLHINGRYESPVYFIHELQNITKFILPRKTQ